MDNTIMKNNFSNNASMMYGTHYIELASDKVTYENNKGKFFITYINPNSSTSSPQDTTLPKNSTSNVVNKKDANSLGVSKITSSNYVELKIPKYFFYITDIKVAAHAEGETPKVTITRKEYKKGQRFVITNTNGNFNDLFIIGVVEEDS